ncbi:helix-turn-helix domain-containing protein [Actinoplanes oblitus]|uniref:Helix-turn-helix domain-containing protein n=1 Tax=Actinoplanes oblitus TaxID=3040509 RepID=A0ABY8WNE1_9ACTN|nr:helix-turn-helix domain-containing protein [Actinoplanes oblitus]WIM97829.1 helix-turn-helix domain-containing protein [Actinoplanes oblitus]
MKITSTKQANQVLHTLRRLANLSRPGLSRRLHVSSQTLRDREQNRRGLSVDALVETANVLGYDVILLRRETGRPA